MDRAERAMLSCPYLPSRSRPSTLAPEPGFCHENARLPTRLDVVSGHRRNAAPRRSMPSTMFGALVDRMVVPDRLTPGFEAHLSPRSLANVYLALGAGLLVAALLRRTDR
jgi:hypothetical protein